VVRDWNERLEKSVRDVVVALIGSVGVRSRCPRPVAESIAPHAAGNIRQPASLILPKEVLRWVGRRVGRHADL